MCCCAFGMATINGPQISAKLLKLTRLNMRAL